MKKHLFKVLFAVLVMAQVNAQTTTENYVKTTTYQKEVTSESAAIGVSDKIENIIYYDGLGRPKQQIGINASPNQKDIVTPIDYDGFGRQDKDYLPYEGATGTGVYNTSAIDKVEDFYDTTKYENTANPYSQKGFEASPLNRVLKQAAPGNPWALGSGHEIEFEYAANTTADAVNMYKVTFTDNDTEQPTLTNQTIKYPAGELYKNITKDENHTDDTEKDHTTEEFTDKQGRVVLKRTYENEEEHDTHYVYDDYGNLTYVIPPKVNTTDGVSALELSELCYQYVYDYRNRLVEKKIPGKDVEYIVYNKLDQPVLTQDALLRANDEWLFSKYDAFGRVIYTGMYTAASNTERTAIQTQVDGNTALFENNNTSFTNNGQTVYYSKNAFPTDNMELFTVNYYDDYRFTSITHTPTTVFGQARSSATKGLATGSLVRVLDEDAWITSFVLYDDKGRTIYAETENEYLNTLDVVKTEFDFIGKVLKTRTNHTKDNNEPIVIQDVYTYDHVGRLLDQHQCIGDATLGENCGEPADNDYDSIITLNSLVTNSTDEIANTSITLEDGFEFTATTNTSFTASIFDAPETGELIAKNSYDALGQLQSKKVGNNTDSPLQNVDYTYNVRGWLKQINNPNEALSDDLFAFKLNYNTIDVLDTAEISETIPLYNGNISETHWKTANDNKARSYYYDYDALNRLNNAFFKDADLNEYAYWSNMSYDKNGNITRLRRHGGDTDLLQAVIDLLSYTYNAGGNKLIAVTDNTTNSNRDEGFKDGNTTGNDYTYDANGNMIADANKGIQEIQYNHLNLPTQIKVNFSSYINYVYDATGTKLEKKVSQGAITHYASNFQYEITGGVGESLKFINHPEGYIEPINETDLSEGFTYVYQYKDHLGNIRLSYAKDEEIDSTLTTEKVVFSDNFETGTGWGIPIGYNTSALDAYDTSKSKSGQQSGKIVKTTNGEKTVHSETWVSINNSEPTEYTYSGWIYSDGPSAELFLFMKEPGEQGYYTIVDNAFTAVTNQWVYLEGSFTVPPNIKTLNLRLDNNGGGTVWFDDVSITTKVKTAPTVIREEKNYYPFGLTHKGYNTEKRGRTHNYGFGGKEEQNELSLNWVDITARNYDPALGRWMNLDPLAEGMRRHSPYNYGFDNPIYFQDPDGMAPQGCCGNKDPLINRALGQLNRGEISPQELTSTSLKSTGAYVAGAAVAAAGVTAVAAGTEATIGFVLNEIKDEVLSTLTNGASDIIDISKNVKNLVQAGVKKLFKKVDSAIPSSSATSSVNLNKQLASEQQMAEVGTEIAGPNSNRPLRKAEQLAADNGGEASDYVKKTSSSHTAPDGTQFETHWEQNLQTGQRFNQKTKIQTVTPKADN